MPTTKNRSTVQSTEITNPASFTTMAQVSKAFGAIAQRELLIGRQTRESMLALKVSAGELIAAAYRIASPAGEAMPNRGEYSFATVCKTIGLDRKDPTTSKAFGGRAFSTLDEDFKAWQSESYFVPAIKAIDDARKNDPSTPDNYRAVITVANRLRGGNEPFAASVASAEGDARKAIDAIVRAETSGEAVKASKASKASAHGLVTQVRVATGLDADELRKLDDSTLRAMRTMIDGALAWRKANRKSLTTDDETYDETEQQQGSVAKSANSVPADVNDIVAAVLAAMGKQAA